MDRKTTRRALLKGLGLGSLVAMLPRTGHSDANSQMFLPSVTTPGYKVNIIIVMADDLGYGDLGAYGQLRIKTPNLDRVAAEGMRFTQYYAAAPACAPSRWSLMTGLHSGHSRSSTNPADLHVTDRTFLELLKVGGYDTACIGKWGLTEYSKLLPTNWGFDYFYGYRTHHQAHNYYPGELYRNDQTVAIPENRHGQENIYAHDLLTEEALKFLDRDRTSPFFLYLPYTIPHVNNEYDLLTGNGWQVPDNSPYTDEDWPIQAKNYAAMVTRLDKDVGKIVDLLKAKGLDDHTILFFTSDNGPGAGRPYSLFQSVGQLRGWKNQLYEGGIRVPMLVRWPGHVKSGAVNNEVWGNWDILATIANIAHVEVPFFTDGHSMLPSLLGRHDNNDRVSYWSAGSNANLSHAVRFGDWKAILPYRAMEVELYHLQDDIGERNNQADRYPNFAHQLRTIIASVARKTYDVNLPFVSR